MKRVPDVLQIPKRHHTYQLSSTEKSALRDVPVKPPRACTTRSNVMCPLTEDVIEFVF